MKIRYFHRDDCEVLVDILRLNGQYDFPEVEGPEAMERVSQNEAALFLVAEDKARVLGMVRAVYDGSRALIHLLSVHPEVQGNGIGSKLVSAVEKELARRGAPGTSASVTERSAGFWEKRGYHRLPVKLMLKEKW